MDWQNAAALVIVAAAVVYLLWDAFKKRPADSPSCGGCGSCGKSEEKLVTIDPRNASS